MKTLFITTIQKTNDMQSIAKKHNAYFVENYSIEKLKQEIIKNDNTFVQIKREHIHNVIDLAKSLKVKIVAICNCRHSIPLKNGIHQEIYIDKNCNIVSTKSRVLIATTNAGKVSIYQELFKKINRLVCSLSDIEVLQTPEENGADEIENAKIKAIFYHEKTNLPVLSNDSGLYIDKLAPQDQPGQFVRRHNGKELTDKQLLDCYIQMIEKVGGQSDAHYNVGLCVIDDNAKIFTKLFQPKRLFISTPSKVMQKGVPLNSIAYDSQSKKYMSEMTAKEKNAYEGAAMFAQQQFIQQHLEQKKFRPTKNNNYKIIKRLKK